MFVMLLSSIFYSLLGCVLLFAIFIHFCGVDETDCRQVRDGSGYTIKLGDKLRPAPFMLCLDSRLSIYGAEVSKR